MYAMKHSTEAFLDAITFTNNGPVVMDSSLNYGVMFQTTSDGLDAETTVHYLVLNVSNVSALPLRTSPFHNL
jgi:hypothetical protein